MKTHSLGIVGDGVQIGTPRSKVAKVALNAYFVSQSVPEIHRKLQTVAIGPDTDSAQLVEAAFRVSNY